MKCKTLEYIGAMLGIVGALGMATVPQHAFVVWVIWAFSAGYLALFAHYNGLRGIFWLQITFLAINILGIYNTWWKI